MLRKPNMLARRGTDTLGAVAESPTATASDVEAPHVVEESESTDDAPYGEGSHTPLEDGSQPAGFPIKGDNSMLYHVPDSGSYEQAAAEVWFSSPAAAEAAGFTSPPSQDEDES